MLLRSTAQKMQYHLPVGQAPSHCATVARFLEADKGDLKKYSWASCSIGCSHLPQQLLDAFGGAGRCCWEVGSLRVVGNFQLTEVQARNNLTLQRQSSAHVIRDLL